MSKATVFLQNGAQVVLQATDLVATGGEGAVYIKGNMAYKIWLDKMLARKNGMSEKIRLLSQVKSPGLVTPEDLLFDTNNQIVGYRMTAIGGEPIISRFSNGWWDANGYDMKKAGALSKQMKNIMSDLHKQGALAIDANEMNWVIDNENAYLIDCDSWQIGKFPGTAIMPSIRDYSAKSFSQESDWFAWAIVAFQLMTGIHPYKGSHPDFKRGDMAGRMQANISVFDPKVKMANAIRPFDAIPPALLTWFENVFQKGLRSSPPDDFETTAVVKRVQKVISGRVKRSDWFTFVGKIFGIRDNLIGFDNNGTIEFKDAVSGKNLNNMPANFIRAMKRHEGVLVRKNGGVHYLTIEANQIVCYENGKKTGTMPTQATSLYRLGESILAMDPNSTQGMLEIALMSGRDGLLPTIRQTWPLLVKSSRFFNNAIVTDCLGTPVVMLSTGTGFLSLPAPGLRKMTILDMVGSNDFALVQYQDPTGNMLLGCLVRKGDQLDIASTIPIDTACPMTILASGVGVTIPEDNKMFLVSPKFPDGKWLDDTGVDTTVRLFTTIEGLAGVSGNCVQKLSMT